MEVNFIKIFWESTDVYELAQDIVCLFLNMIMNSWFPEKYKPFYLAEYL
jgi:hypothetical protein